MSKSIQDKLKASVKASLAKANQLKKHDMTTEEVMTSIGIPKLKRVHGRDHRSRCHKRHRHRR